MDPNDVEPEETRPVVRYEVLIDPANQAGAVDVSDMDLDRVPDKEGVMRFLVSRDQIKDLRSRGIVLDLGADIPVRRLAPELIYSDEEAMADLERRVEGIEREGGS